VSVTGIVLIYAGFLFVEQVNFRRKLTVIFGEGDRLRSVLGQIDRDIASTSASRRPWRSRHRCSPIPSWPGSVVDFAAFWAVMVFFFYYIPTVGSILAIVAPAVLTLVQFDPSFRRS